MAAKGGRIDFMFLGPSHTDTRLLDPLLPPLAKSWIRTEVIPSTRKHGSAID